jgi:hypothetical protein
LIFRDEENLRAEITLHLWPKIIVKSGENHDCIQLDIARFLKIHQAIQRRILEMIFVKLANKPSFIKIDQLLYLAQFGQGGAMLHFSGGLRCRKKDKFLFFSYPQGRVAQRGNLQD